MTPSAGSNGSADAALPPSPATAEQLLTGLLDLIRGSRSIADLDREAVGRATGLPLEQYSESEFGFAGRLTADWNVALSFDGAFMLGPLLQLDFVDDRGTAEGPMTDINSPDLDRFSAVLEQAGFRREIQYGSHGQVGGHILTRDALTVKLVARGEADHPPELIDHLCITTIQVR